MVNLSTRRRKSTNSDILRRLKVCRDQPENQVCADCDDEHPTWASILTTPEGGVVGAGGGKKKLGIFCCYKCCSYHFQLGRELCVVKNINTADEWTEDDIRTMESSGNGISNAIYEGELPGSTQRPDAEDYDAQAKFVEAKYKKLKFFCKKTYQAHGSWFGSAHVDTKDTSKSCHRRSFQEDIMKEVERKPDEELSTTEEESDISQSAAMNGCQLLNKPPAATVVDLGYEAVEDLGYGNMEDLGYGDIDLGYGENIDETESRGVDEKLAKELALRAIDGGGCIRRGSMGRRDSMGQRRGSMCGRRDSMGLNRRGSMGRRASIGRRESMGRRESVGHRETMGRRESMGRRQSIGCRGAMEVNHQNSRIGRRASMSSTGKEASRRGSMGAATHEDEALHSPTGHSQRVRKNVSSHRRTMRRASTCSSAMVERASMHSVHSSGAIRPGSFHERHCRRSLRRSISNVSAGSTASEVSFGD